MKHSLAAQMQTTLAPVVKKRVAAYARVSTEHEEQQTSYDAQVDYYTKKIKERTDWVFVEVYTDKGITGTNTKRREGFNRMVKDALDGKIEISLRKWIQTHYCEHPQKPLEIRHFAAVA